MSLWISLAASCAARAARDRPGAALVLAGRQERDVPEQVVGRANHPVDAGLVEGEVGEEGGRVGLLQLRNLQFDLGADRDRAGSGPRQELGQAGALGRARAVGEQRRVGLVHVDDEEQRLRGEELEPADNLALGVAHVDPAQRPAFLERRLAAEQQIALTLEFRGAALLQVALDPFEALLGHREVGEQELVFHRLRVAGRLDLVRVVRHRRVPEGAHDVHEGVRVAERDHVEQRRRARSARSRDVRELHRRVGLLARLVQVGQTLHSLVRHAGDADNGLELAVPGSRRFALAGHQLEERRFAGRREANQCGAQHDKLKMLSRRAQRPVRAVRRHLEIPQEMRHRAREWSDHSKWCICPSTKKWRKSQA